MTVAMTKIGADVFGRAIEDYPTHPSLVSAPNSADVLGRTTGDKTETSSLVSARDYMIADIFREIKPEDKHFLKYLPDKMLSEEQQTAKQAAITEDEKRIAAYAKKQPNGKLSVKKETQQTQEAMANPDSQIRTPDGKHRVVYHGTSSKATPHDSARAKPEKNQVPRKAIIHRNTMCIARKKDEVRVQFFQEAPMADCAVLP